MWSILKFFAFANGLAGLLFASSELFTWKAGAVVFGLVLKETAANESHAARFARGLGSEGADDFGRASNDAVDDAKKRTMAQTMAKSTEMRMLKLSQRERKKQTRLRAEQATGEGMAGGGGGANDGNGEDAANAPNDGDNNKRNKTNRRNKNGQTPATKMDTLTLETPDANDISLNGEKDNVRSNRKSKNSDEIKIQGSKEGESMAETFSRIQIKLRPENRMKQKRQSTIGAGAFPYRYPKIRYVEWDRLSEDTREIVGAFGYDGSSWDRVSSHGIEGKAFSQLAEGQRKSALSLGIDENVWDCFINHYASYDEQGLVTLGLYEYVKTLSHVQSKQWEQLSKNEIQAATKLCYSKEIWSKEILGTW